MSPLIENLLKVETTDRRKIQKEIKLLIPFLLAVGEIFRRFLTFFSLFFNNPKPEIDE